jgi:hypothetical protein
MLPRCLPALRPIPLSLHVCVEQAADARHVLLYFLFPPYMRVYTHVRRCNKRSDCAWINLKKRLLGSTAHSRRRGGALYVIISCIQFSAVFLVPSTSCWGYARRGCLSLSWNKLYSVAHSVSYLVKPVCILLSG